MERCTTPTKPWDTGYPKMPTRLPVPHRPQQSEAGCLPACVEMVMAYWGIEQTQVELATQLGTDPIGGVPCSRVLRLHLPSLSILYRMAL